jgi:hypothetical protein
MSWFHRAKDRKKLHADLIERGYEPPHPDDEDGFSSYLNTVMATELSSEMSGHFDTQSFDVAPSTDSAASVDSFDAGGGASGGGGADGSW